MLKSAMPRRLPAGCHEDVDKKYNVTRVYYRPKLGMKKIRLRGVPWTAEFMAQYEAAKSGTSIPKASAAPGTFGWLCARYMHESADYKRLAARTRHVRKLIIDSMCEEKIAPASDRLFRDFPLSAMSASDVEVLRDRKLDKPEAANSRVKALRQIFKFGIKKKAVKANIARDVEYFSGSKTGYHTWTVEEVHQYIERHPLGTKAHLALALLLFTMQRRSDVVRFGKKHCRNGVLRFTQYKGRERKPKHLVLPILPVLQAVIDATKCGEETFIVTQFGKAFSDAGFGNKFREWCDQAELPHCSAHGLRKAAATIAAENGATTKQLMALGGWESIRHVEVYTRAAEQKRMAGDSMHFVNLPGKKQKNVLGINGSDYVPESH